MIILYYDHERYIYYYKSIIKTQHHQMRSASSTVRSTSYPGELRQMIAAERCLPRIILEYKSYARSYVQLQKKKYIRLIYMKKEKEKRKGTRQNIKNQHTTQQRQQQHTRNNKIRKYHHHTKNKKVSYEKTENFLL